VSIEVLLFASWQKNLVYVIMKVKMGELGGSKRIASSPSLRSRDELYGIEQRRA